MVTPVAVHCLQGKVSVEHTAAFEELTALQSKYQELQEEDVAIKVHLCAGSAASICAALGHPTSAVNLIDTGAYSGILVMVLLWLLRTQSAWHNTAPQSKVETQGHHRAAQLCWDCMPLTIYCPARLQDQLATLQASFEASTAAATAELEQKTSELDSMKNKLLTERTANRRQMEMSAEVCLQRHTCVVPVQQLPCMHACAHSVCSTAVARLIVWVGCHRAC